MRRLLKIELKRLFRERFFYLSIGIGAVLCVWLLLIQLQEVWELNSFIQEFGTEKLGLYYPRSLYNSFIGLDYAYLPPTILYTVFPLLVTLPYATSYYREKKSGYIKNIFLKTERINYFAAKYISVFLSGFLVALAILLFSLWISALAFPALAPETAAQTFLPCLNSQMLAGLYCSHPFCYTLIYIFIDAVFYGAVATIALGIGMLAGNIMIVFAGSMILYLAADYVAELAGAREFSPLQFLKPTQINCSANPWIILLELLLITIAVTGLFFGRESKKDVF